MNFWTRGYRVSGNQTVLAGTVDCATFLSQCYHSSLLPQGLADLVQHGADRWETQYEARAAAQSVRVPEQRALASARYAAELGSTVMSHSLSSHSGT